jgi:hypothetical protein
MAVLEEYPATLNFGIINKPLSLLSLTLTERDHFSLVPHTFFFGESFKVFYRIGTSGNDEN